MQPLLASAALVVLVLFVAVIVLAVKLLRSERERVGGDRLNAGLLESNAALLKRITAITPDAELGKRIRTEREARNAMRRKGPAKIVPLQTKVM